MPMAGDVLSATAVRRIFRTPAGILGVVSPIKGKPYLFTFAIQDLTVRRLGVLNCQADAEKVIAILESALPAATADPIATESYVREAMVHPV